MLKTILVVMVIAVIGGIASFLIMGLISKKGAAPGLIDGKLAPLPTSPNAVSSDAPDSIEALTFSDDPEAAWARAKKAVSELPRTQIITETNSYLAVECRSALFGFVDDLELHLRADQKIIAIRSASRIGHSDMGANLKRVEALREKFHP